MQSNHNTRSEVPWVRFTCSRQNKEFAMPVERVLHAETYQWRDNLHQLSVDVNKTYVNFINPNPSKDGSLHAVVDMPLEQFVREVISPAYAVDNHQPSL